MTGFFAALTEKVWTPAVLKRLTATFAVIVLGCACAHASTFFWTDWLGSNSGGVSGPFTAQGVISTPTSTVNVTYTNGRGIGFYQATSGTDWWTDSTRVVRNPATSPYTSSVVDNIPTGVDIIALQFAGSQTLTFSQAIANPVFSFVSLNGNGYRFLNQDFDILSFGDPSDGNACGWWGCGTVTKVVHDLGGGNFSYELTGTFEPHGTIRFKGSFDTLTWESATNEFWNGFTVGVQGTADEVFGPPGTEVPEPSSLILSAMGMALLVGVMIRRKEA